MDNKQHDEQPRMSRSQYRQQQRQHDEQQAVNETQEGSTDQLNSREAAASQRRNETVAEKTGRLKRRLNIAIISLIAAIIIVYLILFYVG